MNLEKEIWVIEDDPGAQFVYEEILGLRYKVRLFDTLGKFRSALSEMGEKHPDLVVADLRLPDESFLSFLSTADEAWKNNMPFIVVSSVDDIDALRMCFDQGALDYITKPFGKWELTVKIERILNRAVGIDNAAEVVVDPVSLRVEKGPDNSQVLTSKEFQIMTLLKRAGSQAVSRQDLIDNIWDGAKVSSKTFDVHLFNLRRKIAPMGITIAFVQPDGYRLLSNRVDE